MKIAQVTATFPPYMGGTGNVCYHNSIELANLGHDVTVFTCGPSLCYEYPENISVRHLKPFFKLGNAPFLPGLIKLKDYDLIHLHYPFFFGAELIYLTSKLRKIKYVITYHNDVLSSGAVGLFFKIHRASLMEHLINGASAICVTSRDYAKNSFIQEFVKSGRKRIIEVPNGVDINKFNPNIDAKEIKKRHDIIDKKVILFVGALDTPHFFKGIEYLLKSFAEINREDVRLVVVGDGNLKEYYMDIAKKEGVEGKTIFTGRVSNEDLPKYYAASDLIVLPSVTMGEAFGMVLIEAMAVGRPVIASNLPGIRTVVDHGKNGYLVEPKDVHDLAAKIKNLLENSDKCKEFGRYGREKVEKNYSWTEIASNLSKFYLDII
jgi:glycosyltransferase involved in cell wall biosynthesis